MTNEMKEERGRRGAVAASPGAKKNPLRGAMD